MSHARERPNGAGVSVEFIKEHLTFTEEDSPMANLLLSMLDAVAEFERALILDRQREGIAIAKAEGKYRGGQFKLSGVRAAELRRRTGGTENKAALAREFGISRQGLYSYLKAEAFYGFSILFACRSDDKRTAL